jgi:predicted Rossmann fold flavoprotein
MKYDVIVVGGGAAGIFAAIAAARDGKKVLLLEKLGDIGAKLKATGGGRCNLSNTLEPQEFMQRFGKNGRFMRDALHAFSRHDLIDFLDEIGIQTHAPDGFHIFPTSHNAATILAALKNELAQQRVTLLCHQRVERLLVDENRVIGVAVGAQRYLSKHTIVATGGLGYPKLGAEGDGYKLATSAHHTVTDLSPAMMPLHTQEQWVANCRADTLPKVEIRIDLPKNKLRAKGDLIFTKKGIRGPVVLDFAREITPFFKKHTTIPILVNLTKGMNEQQIYDHCKAHTAQTLIATLECLLPHSVALEMLQLVGIDPHSSFKKITGKEREALIKLLAWTPLTITGHDGYDYAMITRGGISLKEIDPKTMQSRCVKGLYFCGEVIDIDGPCGGYNLQWAFSSGYLAGKLY